MQRFFKGNLLNSFFKKAFYVIVGKINGLQYVYIYWGKEKMQSRCVSGLKWSFLPVTIICRQQNRSHKVQEMCQVSSCPPKQNTTGDVIGITYGRSGSPSTWFCLSPFSISNALWDWGHGHCPIFCFFTFCIFTVSCIPSSLKAGK